MKVIFLDIDGVLNGHKAHGNGYCGFEPKNVQVLNRVLNAFPDLKIVISSAWRYMVSPESMTLKGFEYLLLVGGVDCKGRLAGITARDEEKPTRGSQVANWIINNPGVEAFAIVDDMPMDFEECGFKAQFFQTNGGEGITDEQADVMIEYLAALRSRGVEV